MVYAALQATLELFREPGKLDAAHPVTGMITATVESLDPKARSLAERLSACFGRRVDVTVEDSLAEIGGGALPVQPLPSRAVALRPGEWTNRQLAAAFRRQAPPVFGRLAGDRFLLDVRTLAERDIPLVEAGAAGVARRMERDTARARDA